MLFDEDGPDLSRNHGDDGGDVVFEAVGEAGPPRGVLLVQVGHVLSHALHLSDTDQSNINTV